MSIRGAKQPKRGKKRVSRKIWCGRVDSNHHGIATASPSSWCVCQFRHDRNSEGKQIVTEGPSSLEPEPALVLAQAPQEQLASPAALVTA